MKPLLAWPFRRPVRAGIALAMSAGLAVAGCGVLGADDPMTGYVEAELFYVAAPDSGWLVRSALQEGDVAKTGDVLCELDRDKQQAGVDQAREQLRQAEAKLQDLATGARKEEIEALEAQLSDARTALKLATVELERQSKLASRGVTSGSTLDQARAAFDSAGAKVQTAEANIAVARLGGRDAQKAAAKAERDAAAAALAQADWQLAQRTIAARRGGRVEEVFHRTGEFVTAGTPLLALLPDDALKVRFFVPEARLAALALGTPVEVVADGRTEPLAARISFIARSAEFTPPVIYSTHTRDKLVFLVEARLERPEGVRPGLPVDVRLP